MPPVGAGEPRPGSEPATAAPEPGEAPEPGDWRPVRAGLSDPRRWLGTTAPNGVAYREDDLERIHGVGPYLARRLREAGIVTWRQVAEWDDDDMTLMSRLIGSFPDRIRREDWPASARALHEEAYGEGLS
jgi:predicted flap endonuclease-1-like 5' DNA nuclease